MCVALSWMVPLPGIPPVIVLLPTAPTLWMR